MSFEQKVTKETKRSEKKSRIRDLWPGTAKAEVTVVSLTKKSGEAKNGIVQKITPFLWFDDQAEDAVKFYKGIFKRMKVLKTSRYGEGGARASGQKEGSVMTIEFELEGQRFIALNGGPHFKFTEAISFVVNCKTQAEIDYFWEKLSAGGYKSQCCWLKDKFGVSWQIFPAFLTDLLAGKDAAKANRVMSALMTMRKPDINALKKAAASAPTKAVSKK